MREMIERRFSESKVVVKTKSWQWEGLEEKRWGNCLYLSFRAEDFPQFKRAKLKDCDWLGKKNKRFDYSSDECDADKIDWHGGCTYYSEHYLPEHEVTIVEIGCDYSHYMDDCYMEADCGQEILDGDGKRILQEFLELMKTREENDRS
jgi:hypothetical protein